MSKADRINLLIQRARHHREQMQALSDEFLHLHGEQWGSDDADDLLNVVWDGDNYDSAIRRIWARRAARQGNE